MVKVRSWERFERPERELRKRDRERDHPQSSSRSEGSAYLNQDDSEESPSISPRSRKSNESNNSSNSKLRMTRSSRNGVVNYCQDNDSTNDINEDEEVHGRSARIILRRTTRTSNQPIVAPIEDVILNGEASTSGRRTRNARRSSDMRGIENSDQHTGNDIEQDLPISGSNDDMENDQKVDRDNDYTNPLSSESEQKGRPSADDSSSGDEDYLDEFEEVKLRRSRRHRKQRYETYEESWIIGGGPTAKGYPRRSSRLVKESKTDYATSDYGANGNGLADGGATDLNESEEDMYSRVKKRRTSFGGRTNRTRELAEAIRKRSRSISLPTSQQENEEPVSRRLRDRQKLTMNAENSNIRVKTRQNKTEMLLRNRLRRKRKRRTSSASSSSTSSSSDSSGDDIDMSPSKKRKRALAGPGFNLGQNKNMSKKEMMMLMEVQPIAVDPNINFSTIGGLEQFIGRLKEIVLFPLMYGEFYEQRGMRPPRGILLHGPPGTGKTLLARALANECSNINGKKVSFFLRKGADLLNKWIGESERQLRMLFQQAALHQPSIIFFDEIDGLAPVRSAKSDQIHNSIVSTLLAELDGLQDRGQVIVIGSTNRLDFIDPALRRPGRFDCELPIFLPTRDGRREILKVHVSKWKDLPSEILFDELADRSIGFSGADLKLLCWNASMNSLRRTYPQIYGCNLKYLLDYESIKMQRDDWEIALKTVSPSTSRSLFSKYSPSQPLPLHVKPLLENNLKTCLEVMNELFPFKSLTLVTEDSVKRLVLHTLPESGLDTYIIPALLHTMETLPVHVLSYEALHMDGIPIEFSVTQICAEVLKESGPSVLYIPSLDRLILALSENAKEVIIRMINQSLKKPILILATIQETSDNLLRQEDEELMNIFRGCYLTLESPNMRSLKKFFKPVFETALNVKVKQDQLLVVQELPLAPQEILEKKISNPEELRAIVKRETAIFRELRIFLREVLSKIVRNKKFEEFTKPVDMEEVPDYLDVIVKPMDLETMMCKVNMGQYQNGNQFMEDVKLIASNCLNYNPHKTDSDKRLRLRAFELLDIASKLIEEMNSDFEDQCNSIIQARIERNAPVVEVPLIIEPDLENPDQTSTQAQPSTSNFISTNVSRPSSSSSTKNGLKTSATKLNNGISDDSVQHSAKKIKRKSLWSKGCVKKPMKKKHLLSSSSNSQELSQDSLALDQSQDLSQSPKSGKSISPILTRKDSSDADVTIALYNTRDGNSEIVGQSETLMDVFVEEEQSERKKVDSPGKNKVTCKNEAKMKERFKKLLEEIVKVSENFTTVKLLDMRFHILRLIEKHQYETNKEELALEIEVLINAAREKESRHTLLRDKLT